MGRTRRQPPLYEVLSSPSRRLGGSTAAPRPGSQPPPAADPPPPVPELKPVPTPAAAPDVEQTAAASAPTIRVHAPASDYSRAPAPLSSPTAALPSATAEEDGPVRISSTTMMIGLGLLIIVFAVVWAVAFQMGQKKRDNDLGQWMPTDTGQPDGGTSPIQPPAPTPVRPNGSGNQARPPEPAKPDPTPAPATGGDPRVPGLNYLYLGTLTLKDATAGVEFLKRNGVQAFHVVDRSRGGVNNPPCRIYASQGFAGGVSFRETQKERDELVRRVEELGKKWQREEKGPSDFRQPYWTLHKE